MVQLYAWACFLDGLPAQTNLVAPIPMWCVVHLLGKLVFDKLLPCLEELDQIVLENFDLLKSSLDFWNAFLVHWEPNSIRIVCLEKGQSDAELIGVVVHKLESGHYCFPVILLTPIKMEYKLFN